MSTNQAEKPAPTPSAPRPMMGRGPFGAGMMPPAKAKHFGPSAKRLLRLFAVDRVMVGAVLFAALVSVLLNVSGPKILGRATNLIFAGFLGGRMPAALPTRKLLPRINMAGKAMTSTAAAVRVSTKPRVIWKVAGTRPGDSAR